MNYGFFPFFFWGVLGLFLAGVYAWRNGFFSPSAESLPRYRKAMWWGLGIGLAGNLAITAIRWTLPIFPPSPMNLLLTAIHTVAVPALSLGYVCAAIVICQRGAGLHRLRHFSAIGRTALTNYLLQSLLGTLLFYGYGLGLMGKMGPALLLIPTVAIYAVQAVASEWWLTRYRFGPVECAWRSLTYGSAQPMVRASVATLRT